jgi:glucuronate isomerase
MLKNIAMTKFIHPDFMLGTDAARELYHRSAENQPIIDYHCHLDPRTIAENAPCGTITEMWLAGDHYKWRAMRADGVGERYVTGDAGDWEKFERWAATVPHTMRNPLYHWTHLELARVLGIDRVLSPATARAIYDEANERLATMRARDIIGRFGVEVICTTDDPADSLEHHRAIAAAPFGCRVLPTWRPDAAVAIEKPTFGAYIERLGAAADVEIVGFQTLMDAIARRHDAFAAAGCRLSDHGMETFYADDFTDEELDRILRKALAGRALTASEIDVYRSGMLHHLAVMDAEKGWAQQFHVGVIRNNNSLMFSRLGADTGYDAILDLPVARAGHKFLDRLAVREKLAKTILYNLNPKDTEVLATMAGTFNDGSVAGKMQLGAAWWFLDQEDGRRKQLAALSSLGLLARFVGMLTDSRSLMSYTRHEYFRRILCDVVGADVESGRLPHSEMATIHSMIADIACRNARDYFGF